MIKYENAMKLMEERCGGGKDNMIALATIALAPNADGKPRPAVRMVDAYYEEGAFYISTDARKSKALEIAANDEVAIGGVDWFAAWGRAENLGWVKDERNAEIRAKMKKYFCWFDEHGDEDNPNSIVLRIVLTSGIITDHDQKYGEWQYRVDFAGKTAQ